MQLPATAIHDVSSTSITLQNTTAHPQTFEFTIPKCSDLTLSPHVATIMPQERLRVLLRYCPQPGTLPAAPEEELQTVTSSVGAGDAAGTSGSSPAEHGQGNVSILLLLPTAFQPWAYMPI